jgi:hypothetical protein
MVEGTFPGRSLPQGAPPTDPCNNAAATRTTLTLQIDRLTDLACYAA